VRVKGAHLMEPVNAAPALEVTPITLF
jgi:hypothetical protein